MKILLSSYCFYPSCGGIETSSEIYARMLAELGNEVVVVTETSLGDVQEREEKFKVIRQPSVGRLFELHRWCDVVLHNHLSLRMGLPLMLVRKPWFVIHQTWLGDSSIKSKCLVPLKKWVCRRAYNMVLSHALEVQLGFSAEVIGNPFDDKIFKNLGLARGRCGMVFVGRLVSDKGVDIAIRALKLIEKLIPGIGLDIIGSGPDAEKLRRLVEELELTERVRFLGMRVGSDLAVALNGYEVALVPSRWNEPFGIVALEAIACGCVVIGSQGGGLPEAIGNCGLLFKNNDYEDLSNKILKVYEDANLRKKLILNQKEHLEKFSPLRLAKLLNERFEGCMAKK